MLVAVCTLLASDRWRSVLASAYAKATGEDGGSEPTVASSEALQGYVFTAKSSALVKLHCNVFHQAEERAPWAVLCAQQAIDGERFL